MTTKTLDALNKRTHALAAAAAAWEQAIRKASGEGHSLRAIAAAARCSHQTVKNILDRG